MRLFSKYLFLFIVSVFINSSLYFFPRKRTSCIWLVPKKYIYAENNTERTGKTSNQLGILETTIDSVRHGTLPNSIVQYGIGGTATTLQFQILCILLAISHESEINSVGCYFGRKPAHKYTVIKTHVLTDSLLRTLQSDTWIFMTFSNSLSPTAKSELEAKERQINERKIRIPYIQYIDMVSKRGHFIVYEYQQIFGVSEKKIEQVLDYLRYWDILRLCCGKQMSADWRNHLSPRKNYKPHHDRHSPTYPACEMYNISLVEQLLMKTYVFEHFANITSLKEVIGKPSNVDSDIDGSYCVKCNNNISLNHLTYNEDCV